MAGDLTGLIDQRKQLLLFYSPYNFLRNVDPEVQFEIFLKEKILQFASAVNHFVYSVPSPDGEVVFLYEYLEWDSKFLNRKCFKLFTVLYGTPDAAVVQAAINSFKSYLEQDGFAYGFIDIPAEDIFLIQNLTKAGFGLVETRFHFFKDNIQAFKEERNPVRKAIKEDATIVAEVARAGRNNYDRLHADFYFPDELADDYLGVYAESAVNGFCDSVLIPDENGLPVASFLAINHIEIDSEKLDLRFARIVLTAVGIANKGWHQKLVSETIYYAKERGADYVLMTTQATNRAVFRTCEKLNFKLGSTSHILAFHS